MPTIPLAVGSHGRDIIVDDLAGGTLAVPCVQFRCLLEVPGFLLPRDAIIDTGAPLTIFPQKVWFQFRAGIDFDFLPFVGSNPPAARIAGWQFTFQIARFRVPLALLDAGLSTRVPRPGVIAQFAIGDPPGWRSLPPVLVGLWGGLLEDGRLGIARSAGPPRVTGELIYP